MKYINGGFIAKIIISVTLSVIVFTGCGSILSGLSKEIVLGQLSDVKNGKLLIHVVLEDRVNAWYIIFGEPQYPEKMDDKILNQELTISIANTAGVKMIFRDKSAPIEILPGKEKVWYSGTLSNLIFKTGAIKTLDYFSDQPCKFDIILEFEDKSIEINDPIIIHAYRPWY